ncbi:ABC transporter permease [Allostreptomyces psammosilenae]|uniref:Peptide/nickel transport system permease protein n=1 Tax=Allostreptomyces psammosilenae TaxID=1892865 RepID=A0A852ZY62_9ACTN|nr:ABC transporter permease [Allostreptomyces psammosilenae]NYI06737.1 peptide/nickel transport system permease protein [Allostreptomyces psammosilenae]
MADSPLATPTAAAPTAAAAKATAPTAPARTPGPDAWRPAAGRRTAPWRRTDRWRLWTSVGVLAVVALAVLLVPPIVQLDQQHVDFAAKLRPPSADHPLGTDDAGRDLLWRCVYGLRVSLMVGLVAALVATVVGILVGGVAGVLGGWVDRVVMRLVDAFSSIPHLLLGIFLVAMFRPGPWGVVVSVGLTHWLSTARIVRSEMLSLRERPFVEAAISGGASRGRVLVRHLLPGVLPRAALAAVLMVPHAIWHESALSYLGLGMPPHLASLGAMIEAARGSLLLGAWWPTLFPGLFIIVPTLAVSGLAGVLRDRLSPRRRSELML